MKKTIAMISALAISASMVMPLGAFAEDAVKVTKVAYDEVKDFATIQQMVDYFGLTETGTAPTAITVEDENATEVHVLYAYNTTNGIITANFMKTDGTWVYSSEGSSKDLDGLKSTVEFGIIYMVAPEKTENTYKQDEIPTNAATDVEYTVDPAYMVTIPASVTLSSSDEQTKTVTAENVKLDYGKEVVVKLTGASNTTSGKTFHAMTADNTSTATYNINEGTLGLDEGSNIVAAFPTFTNETTEADKKKEIKFSAASGATFAGEHSELLTFTLSVEASEQGGSQGESASDWKTASVDGVSLYVKDGATWAVIAGYAGNSGKIAVDEYNQIWINGSGLYDEAKDKTVSATDIYSENGQYSLYSV